VNDTALSGLRRAALTTALARHLQGDVETDLLQAVVDAAVALFEAEAASIALFEPSSGRLVFRVAAGARGANVVGLSVLPGQGITGQVFSGSEAVAIADVAADPRFDRRTAEQTGYLPRSLAAVPLVHRDRQLAGSGSPVGVLQVLDKRTADAFSVRDMELLAVFAHQATTALGVARAGADPARLLRKAIADVAAGALDAAALEQLAAVATAAPIDDDSAYGRLVERVAGLRAGSATDPEFVDDLLVTMLRHRQRPDR